MVICRNNKSDFTMKEQVALGKNLRYFRKRKGLTLRRVSEETDISKGTLGVYESYGKISLERLIKLSNYYSIPMEDLLTNHKDFVNKYE